MKTFKDFNLTFELASNCQSCRDGYCSSTAVYSKTGEDFNLSIYTNPTYTDIQIVANSSSNTDSTQDIEVYFDSEEKAVKFLCENFNDFKCR